jgi:ADP-dependent NAD(P)H-hydrate dehydratase / NAD(P)H-hydrate epimerase
MQEVDENWLTFWYNEAVFRRQIMKLVSVSEMRLIEQQADADGLTYAQMMENAGHNLAAEVAKISYSQEGDEDMQVLGLVGPGNNGGDTLVALAHLAEKGWTARAYSINRKKHDDPLLSRLETAGGEVVFADDDDSLVWLQAFIESADVLLDGVLGTGFKPPIKQDVGQILEAARAALNGLDWPPLVVAVDCPSGIDCDSGQTISECLSADATITMGAVKQGLLKLPAFNLLGELRLVEIGSLDNIKSWQEIQNIVADDEMAKKLSQQRPLDAHKGTFGTALIVAGSINYTGAALLSAKSAYRSGAGLVIMAVPEPLYPALAGHIPEATWVLLPDKTGVISSSAADVVWKNLERVTAMLVGPGLGMEATTREFLENLIVGGTINRQGHIGFVNASEKKPEVQKAALPALVIDADGVKLLAKIPDWPKLLPSGSILTPHPGEMSILTSLAIEDIQADRLNIARKCAVQWGHVVVLKGAFTVIANPDGQTTTIPVATPALARAGTGDVLAGLITGLRAQGMGAYDAARLGAWIHAQAGLSVAAKMGTTASVMAGDLLDAIPTILSAI